MLAQTCVYAYMFVMQLSRYVAIGQSVPKDDTFNWPADFDAEKPIIPFIQSSDGDLDVTLDLDGDQLMPTTTGGNNQLTWLMAEACLTQPLHVRITKPVYQQIMNSIDNLVLEDDEEDVNESVLTEILLEAEELDEEEEEDVNFTSILGLQDEDDVHVGEKTEVRPIIIRCFSFFYALIAFIFKSRYPTHFDGKKV